MSIEGQYHTGAAAEEKLKEVLQEAFQPRPGYSAEEALADMALLGEIAEATQNDNVEMLCPIQCKAGTFFFGTSK